MLPVFGLLVMYEGVREAERGSSTYSTCSIVGYYVRVSLLKVRVAEHLRTLKSTLNYLVKVLASLRSVEIGAERNAIDIH